MDRSFALYGCGKAGLAVSLALKAGGWSVVGCDSRNPESRELGAQWLNCQPLSIPEEIPPEVPIMIGVSENAMGEVDRKIAEDRNLRERVVFHLSGVLPSRALNICRLRGAKVGSLHPLMILPDPLTGARNLRNATFALEGREQAIEVLKKMAMAISGKFFILPVKGKTLYHIAAVTASNYLVTLLSQSMELLEKAGVPHEESLKAFQSLVEMTAKNAYSEGPVQALTGPVERGDIEMIRHHLHSLSKMPRSRMIYSALALCAIDIARKKHPDREETYSELEKLLG